MNSTYSLTLKVIKLVYGNDTIAQYSTNKIKLKYQYGF